MSFVRQKEIPSRSGNWYSYLVESYSTPAGPRQKVLQYLGKVGEGRAINNLGTMPSTMGNVISTHSPVYRLGTTQSDKPISSPAKINPKKVLTNASDSAIVNASKGEEKKTMNDAELEQKEREYDNFQNEGGDGYNPYRAEREKREIESAAPIVPAGGITNRQYNRAEQDKREWFENLPEDSPEKLAYARRQRETNAIFDRIQAEKKEKQARFPQEWPLSVTIQRRAEWNKMIREEGGKIPPGRVFAIEAQLGYNQSDLRYAVQYYTKTGEIK